MPSPPKQRNSVQNGQIDSQGSVDPTNGQQKPQTSPKSNSNVGLAKTAAPGVLPHFQTTNGANGVDGRPAPLSSKGGVAPPVQGLKPTGMRSPSNRTYEGSQVVGKIFDQP